MGFFLGYCLGRWRCLQSEIEGAALHHPAEGCAIKRGARDTGSASLRLQRSLGQVDQN
jgi:hypothetical protein